MTLRVAMIGQRGVPATWGGVERHVEEVGARLVERGVDVTVYCRPSYVAGHDESHRGMHLEHVKTWDSKHLDAIVHSARTSARSLRGFDVVHYHALGPGLMSPLPRFLSSAKVVQTIHGRDDQRGKWGGLSRVALRTGLWLSARVPDAVVTVSQELARQYREDYGCDAVAIPNGVPEVSQLSPNLITQRYGLHGGDYVLYVGRLVPEKAPDELITAFRELSGTQRLVIAGGSSHTDAYVQSLRELGAGDERVIFTGYVDGDLLTELYSNAGVFVQASHLEGMPLTLLEAVVHGTPIVATGIAPHVEVFGRDGPGHRLVAPGDIAGLARAVQATLDDPEAAQAGIEALRARVVDEYSWDAAADRLLEVYRSLV